MKSVQLLKNIHEEVATSEGVKRVPLDTIYLLKIAINSSNKPMNIEEMGNRLELINIVKNIMPDDTELKLEDAVYERLSKYVKEVEWNFVSQHIYDFVKSFN